jgi:hypothetical protein
MEICVAKAAIGDPVQGRRGDYAAEGTRHPVTGIVSHDQEHIRRPFGRYNARRPIGLGLIRCFLDMTTKFSGRRRDLVTLDGRSGAWGAGYPVDLLGLRRYRGNHDPDKQQ